MDDLLNLSQYRMEVTSVTQVEEMPARTLILWSLFCPVVVSTHACQRYLQLAHFSCWYPSLSIPTYPYLTLPMLIHSKLRHQADAGNQDDDPLTKAIAPPPNETEVERAVRVAAEREAQKISDAIDEELNRQRMHERKVKCVRVLLLGKCSTTPISWFLRWRWAGQSESGMCLLFCLWTWLTPTSGKSTTLKSMSCN